MADFAIPYPDFQANTVADSEKVDANFAAIAAVVGTNNFSVNNYVADGASLTANLDAVDIALKSLNDLLSTKVKIDSWDVFNDDLNPPENIEWGAAQAINFANGVLSRARFQFRADILGYHKRIFLRLATSTASASALGLNVAYRINSLGTSQSVTTALWQASKVYSASDKVIGLDTGGDWREFTAAGGTSNVSEPTWPTTGTVADNGWNWTAGNVIFKNLDLSHTPAASVGDFEVDSSSLQVPSSEITAITDEIVGFFWRSAGDAHAGDLYLLDGWNKPVEA